MTAAVDTSALGKLLVEEPESPALRIYLAEQARAGTRFYLSTIATTELRRLAVRLDLDTQNAETILERFTSVRLTEGILQLAGRLPHRNLGTLGAIHISSALNIEVSTLVTYDVRQAHAAKKEGLAVVSPGRMPLLSAQEPE